MELVADLREELVAADVDPLGDRRLEISLRRAATAAMAFSTSSGLPLDTAGTEPGGGPVEL